MPHWFRPITLRLFVFAWIVGLAGCGGGGSDSDNDPPPPLTLSPTSAAIVTTQGLSKTLSTTVTINTQVVTIDSSFALLIRASGPEFKDSIDGISLSNTSLQLTFYTSTALAVGQYSGTLEFYACKDENCASYYSDTPAKLSYEITVDEAPPVATLAPSSIGATVEAGDPLQIALNATYTGAVSYCCVAAYDPQGRFKNEVTTTLGVSVPLILELLPIEVAGTYSGTVFLRFCNSSPCESNNQVPGSPLAVPYTITVTPANLLQPVPTATGLPEWETFQGNAAHTGYVPVTLANPGGFSLRWTWTKPTDSATLSPITTGSGMSVVTTSGYFSPASLFVLNEADGSLAWQHDFGSIFAANHPAVAAGRVFVATSGHDDTFMWSFDLGDGTQKFQTPFESQWEHYLAPTFKNGYVYTNGGESGGMYAFKASTGVKKWFAALNQYDLWSPAIDGDYAYAYTGNEFAAIDLSSGARAFTIANPTFNWVGYALNIAPVLPGDGSALVVDGIYQNAHANHLVRYSIANANELWRVDGQFLSTPAVAAGTLYVLNAVTNSLEARNVATGALLWSWTPTDANETLYVGNLVLTDNLVFLSTGAATYAIDLATHQDVWNVPQTGHLAMSSNKVFYIVSETAGTISAYQLL